jgi:diaminopimelate epimerase
MQLNFTKMHGLGNDFVVIDAINQSVNLSDEQVRALADRRFGVGCDQVLLVERPGRPEADFRYRIFNADGSEVEQCGNGARCFARFVRDKGLTDKDVIPVETASGLIELHLAEGGQVRVNMGRPRFQPAELPFEASEEQLRYELEVEGRQVSIGAVSMGNPHTVLQVESVDAAPVEQLGPAIESHPRFPARVNVGFMEIVDKGRMRLRVYERGAGETLACGTGACAAAVIAQRWGLVEARCRVELRGGSLEIQWAGGDEPVWMTGPAVTVFEGTIEL